MPKAFRVCTAKHTEAVAAPLYGHTFAAAGLHPAIAPASAFSWVKALATLCGLAALCGCGRSENPPAIEQAGAPGAIYRVGPLDALDIFVWRMPELSRTVTVRPDGRISMPLIDDLAATGKTPSQLAKDIERALAKYVQDPTVTVIVGGFHGPFDQQVRIIGEAADPQALPYQANMTVLDVMIAVHGLTRFASGNRAELIRVVDGRQATIPVRLDDLIKDGEVGANVPVEPGDILIIPQAWF